VVPDGNREVSGPDALHRDHAGTSLHQLRKPMDPIEHHPSAPKSMHEKWMFEIRPLDSQSVLRMHLG